MVGPQYIFLDICTNKTGEYPSFVTTTDYPLLHSVFRIRAHQLWSDHKVDAGWAVLKGSGERNDPLLEPMGTPQGIFSSEEDALSDLRIKVEKYVLPFFDEHEKIIKQCKASENLID